MADDTLLVAALMRREGRILLVRRQFPDAAGSHWALPGGTVQPGELLVQSLVRSVREEIGAEILRVGDLVRVTQLHYASEPDTPAEDLPPTEGRATTFVFEVAEWKGERGPGDLSTAEVEARFWPRNEAIERLESHPARAVREPIVAYLRGGERDRVWLYREDAAGNDELQWPAGATTTELSERARGARALFTLGCLVILALLIIIVIIGIITLARPYL